MSTSNDLLLPAANMVPVAANLSPPRTIGTTENAQRTAAQVSSIASNAFGIRDNQLVWDCHTNSLYWAESRALAGSLPN